MLKQSLKGVFKFVEQSKKWYVSDFENFDQNPFIGCPNHYLAQKNPLKQPPTSRNGGLKFRDHEVANITQFFNLLS